MSDSATTTGFPCRQCGANLEFVPGTTHIKCPFCTTENQIDAAGTVSEQDFGAVLASLEQAAPHAEHRTIRCQACAAEVEVPANVTSMACCFCGTNIVSFNMSDADLEAFMKQDFVVGGSDGIAGHPRHAILGRAGGRVLRDGGLGQQQTPRAAHPVEPGGRARADVLRRRAGPRV
ncbi:MAG: hypothetical protein DYG92_08040 [Leptolyngbya sp. PLA1]|nr:hypothetical protein [Leptolyngbya sp. PLA1]